MVRLGGHLCRSVHGDSRCSIVNVALPSIERGLHFSEQNLLWVLNAYALMFGGFLMLGGRVADKLGRRRVFITGVVIFTVASLFCGLATSSGWLVASRAVQGLGAAILSPAALSILTVTFEEGRERNTALSIWGAIAGAGGAFGVLLGGILTQEFGWQWIYYVNVPIGSVVVLASFFILTHSLAEDEDRGFDIPGAVTLTAGLVLTVFALVKSTSWGWASANTLGILAAAFVLIALFVVIERRTASALVPLSIFGNRSLSVSNLVSLALGASIFSMFYFLSLYMQQVLGYSALEPASAICRSRCRSSSRLAPLIAGGQAGRSTRHDHWYGTCLRRTRLLRSDFATRNVRGHLASRFPLGRCRSRPLVRAGDHRRDERSRPERGRCRIRADNDDATDSGSTWGRRAFLHSCFSNDEVRRLARPYACPDDRCAQPRVLHRFLVRRGVCGGWLHHRLRGNGQGQPSCHRCHRFRAGERTAARPESGRHRGVAIQCEGDHPA